MHDLDCTRDATRACPRSRASTRDLAPIVRRGENLPAPTCGLVSPSGIVGSDEAASIHTRARAGVRRSRAESRVLSRRDAGRALREMAKTHPRERRDVARDLLDGRLSRDRPPLTDE